MSRWTALTLSWLSLLLALLASCGSTPSVRGSVTDERWLEARLLAPCCWTQTLDVHESPIAHELRAEVRARLSKGEAPGAIEDDLVARYGEGIRALPKGQDPRTGVTCVVLVLLLAGAIGLGRLILRWTRNATTAPVALPAMRDLLDDRLDAELRDLDE